MSKLNEVTRPTALEIGMHSNQYLSFGSLIPHQLTSSNCKRALEIKIPKIALILIRLQKHLYTERTTRKYIHNND